MFVAARRPSPLRRTRGRQFQQLRLKRPLILYTISGDTTAPVVTITVGPTPNKMSRVATKDYTDITFEVDEAVQAWKVKIVPATNSVHSAGTEIEAGGSLAASTPQNVTITDDEFVAASAVEGVNIVKVFTQDNAGNWSE